MSYTYLGSDHYFLWPQQSWRNLDDRYVLGNGTLIKRDGSIVWVREWGHIFRDVYLFEDQGCIITDRQAKRGPWSFTMGIVCIELSDGSYRWSYGSEDTAKNNRALMAESRPESPKFEMLKNPKSDGNNLITRHFLIDFTTGRFTRRDADQPRKGLRRVPPSAELKYRQGVFEDFDLEFLNNHPTYPEGHAFSPIQRVWDTETELMVSANPETRNGPRLLAVDPAKEEILTSWQLPIDGAVHDVSPFFDQGLLLQQWANERFYLTLLWTEEKV